MYEQIAKNKRKSFFLVFFFLVLIFALTWAFSEVTNLGVGGLVLAAILAVFMTWGSYYYSDKINLLYRDICDSDDKLKEKIDAAIDTLPNEIRERMRDMSREEKRNLVLETLDDALKSK